MSKPNSLYTKLSDWMTQLVPVDLTTKLDYNGATPTDISAALNTYLAQALEKLPMKLIVDIGAGVLNSLIVKSYTDIEGCGWDTGFVSMDQTYAALVINNGGPFPPAAGTPGALTYNFRLANLKIDGNRRHNGKVDASGNWVYPIYLANLARICMDHVWVYDPPSFAVVFNNCKDIVLTGCRIESPADVGNCDGFHFDGPASDIRISECYFNLGDDSIALNSPEGYGGNIERVVVNNCVFENCTSVLRVYSGSTTSWVADRIVVSNCVGNFQGDTSGFIWSPFLLGFSFNPSNTEAVRDFQAVNCSFRTVSSICYIQDLIGAVTFADMIWDDSGGGSTPWMQMGGPNSVNNTSITDVTFRNCRIRRITSAGSGFLIGRTASSTGHTLGTVRITGVSVENEKGAAYAAIPYLIDMAGISIGTLVIDDLDPTNITALVNPVTGFTGITQITGSGLAACGFQVPDALVRNGVQYISDGSGGGTAGHLCVKNPSGTVVVLA